MRLKVETDFKADEVIPIGLPPTLEFVGRKENILLIFNYYLNLHLKSIL